MAKDKKAPKEDEKSSTPDAGADNDTDALDSDEAAPQRSAKADAFWEKVGVEPIEIAMPKGVGLTLRAYRMSDSLEDEEDVKDADEADAKVEDKKSKKSAKSDDEDLEGKTKAKGKGKKKKKAKDEDDDDVEASGSEEELEDDAETDDVEDEEDEAKEAEPEEVPVFLTINGKLPLFETPEALVEFVKSGAPTELDAIDTWDKLVKGIKSDFVIPAEDDNYELDLVVKNLRGGHDTWDPALMISAGELARDLGFALRLPSVMSTLAVGSPLDGLDNHLRSVVNGGIKAVFARRKIRKVGTQQTALAWRGIVNKINETVDWRN